MARPFKCPFCGATDSVSKGVRKTKTMGIRRIRLCNACGRKFTPKSQKPGEPPNQEAEECVEPSAEPQKEVRAPPEPRARYEHETSGEPAEALARVFPPPDQEWTS